MQPATLVADESRPTPVRWDDDSVLINAFGTVARQLRGPLANFLVFVELSDVYSRYRALGDPHHSGKGDREFRDRLMRMMAQAKETGDPLGFVDGMVDVARLIRRAISLSMPIAQNRGIRLEAIGPVPIALSGDQRLLLDAVDALTTIALQAPFAQSTIQIRTESRLDSAAIEVVVPGLVLSPGQNVLAPVQADTVQSVQGDDVPIGDLDRLLHGLFGLVEVLLLEEQIGQLEMHLDVVGIQ